jgi:signal transduction histidine kinase
VTSRPTRNDVILAVSLAVGAILSSVLYRIAGVFDQPAPAWVTLPWALAVAIPLAWRRIAPITSAVIVSAGFIVGGLVFVPELLVCNITLFLAIYSVGAWSANRRRATIARIAITAAMIGWLLVSLFVQATDPSALPNLPRPGAFSPMVAFMLLQLLTNILYFSFAFYFGDRAWAAARAREQLEQRTEELGIERSRLTEQAVALDRVRIARELHDSVAHHVSVMGVQAAAARATLESNPAVARTSLLHVEETARTAVDELHRMLTTLRDTDHPEQEGASDPEGTAIGVGALPALVAASSRSGIPTRLDVVGHPRDLPPAVSLNLYRIAQEALTNARKHAGPGAEADVRLRYLDESVELEIANTGAVRTRRSPGGLGQLGMRERVAASGGMLEIGPRSRGGYVVRARVPFGAS